MPMRYLLKHRHKLARVSSKTRFRFTASGLGELEGVLVQCCSLSFSRLCHFDTCVLRERKRKAIHSSHRYLFHGAICAREINKLIN